MPDDSSGIFSYYNYQMEMEYSIAIQAGGESSRMGQDKGLLQFGGMALVEYIHDQISGMGSDAFIVSNHPEAYLHFGLPVFADIYKGIGALGGIHTVLSHTNTEKVLILACDMPFVNTQVIKYLLSFAPEFDVVVPRIHPKGFVEPFKAVYSKSCLPAIEKAIAADNRRVISFFDDVSVKYIEKEEIAPLDPDYVSFLNVNTPEDLKKALELAEELK